MIGDRHIVRKGKTPTQIILAPEEKKMSKDLVLKNELNALEKVLIKGNLAGLSENQRISYVRALCKAVGISPLFQPFDYIEFQGKLQIYAKRSCTEQLRNRKGKQISIRIIARERIDGLYVVTAHARDKDGREDESIGAVNIKGLGGKDLENALMRAETKAKRRVTLSICGLGIMDEIEIEEVAKKEAAIEADLATEATEAKLVQTTGKPEFEQAPSPSVDQEPPHESDSKDEYRIKSIRAVKGKTLKQVPTARLIGWLKAYNELIEKGPVSPAVQDDAFHVKAYLDAMEMDAEGQLPLEAK